MDEVKAKDLGIDSMMVDTSKMAPVIRTEDVQYKQPTYLIPTVLFETADAEAEIPLECANISNGQIRSEDEKILNVWPGMLEKKKRLTVIV